MKNYDFLKGNEKIFREIAESINKVFWLESVDRNKFYYLSPNFELIWGLDRETVFEDPRSWVDSIVDEDRIKLKEEMEGKIKGEISEDYIHVYRITRPDGSIRWIQSRTFPVYDEDGEIRRVAGIAEDITEQKKTEEALRESEERLMAISEGSFEGIGLSEKGVILDANNQFAEMLGYTLPELIGKKIIDLVPPDSHELVAKMIKEDFQGIYESKTIKKDGTIITIETQARYTNYMGRKVRLTSMRDITERKQAEEALNRSSQLAAAGQMASGIAHEINNPLATISACAEVIEKESEVINMDSPQLRKLYDYIKLIREESTRASGIIGDLLDFTRDKSLTPTKFKVCEVTKKTVHLFEVQSSYENYNFQLSIAEELPMIKGDRNRIRQVIIIMLTNAVESMPDGGVISVSCEWDSKEELVILKVSDDGVGITEEKQKEIFEPFYTSKMEGIGTGLGLSIAQDIVEKHNGVMEVQSSLGEGSTFSVKFPNPSRK